MMMNLVDALSQGLSRCLRVEVSIFSSVVSRVRVSVVDRVREVNSIVIQNIYVRSENILTRRNQDHQDHFR